VTIQSHDHESAGRSGQQEHRQGTRTPAREVLYKSMRIGLATTESIEPEMKDIIGGLELQVDGASGPLRLMRED
jgi:hypothetical protein